MAESKDERAARQAEALRRNLQRRKAQARSRRAAPPPEAPSGDADPDGGAET